MAKETPAQKQTRARILYEKDGLTQPEVAARVGVSPRTIANWLERGLPNPMKGPWEKGSLARKVHEKREESILAAAAKLGLTDEFFLGKVKQLCEATRPALVKGDKDEEAEAKQEGDDSGGAFVQEIPDYRAISDGLTHAERIIPGLKAQERVEHDLSSEMLAFFQGDE